jgi:hypothetical protein
MHADPQNFLLGGGAKMMDAGLMIAKVALAARQKTDLDGAAAI